MPKIDVTKLSPEERHALARQLFPLLTDEQQKELAPDRTRSTRGRQHEDEKKEE
jgi:hypothetical protein